MPGGFFSAKGTAVAPTNVFFPTVADKYTMLNQIYGGTAVGFVYNVAAAAKLVSTWQPFNLNFNGGSNTVTASFGAAQSAPDGTTNGIKVIEGANTNVHAVVAGVGTDQTGIIPGWTLRVSVFAKSDGSRTRFAMYVGDLTIPTTTGNGSRCVFDLAGVQIGVAPNNFGSTSPGTGYFGSNAEIVNFGNGWCRCTMDVQIGARGSATNLVQVGLVTDSGSGTAAESTNYAGDNSSGVLFWRATALPVAAFGLSTQMFADEFTDLSGFDVNGGSRWATTNVWPESSFNFGVDMSKLSITGGTILNVAANSVLSPHTNAELQTAKYNGAGGLTPNFGFTFKPSVLLETSYAYDVTVFTGDGLAFWTINIEHLLDVGGETATDIEHDFLEVNELGVGGRRTPVSSMLFGPAGTIGSYNPATGWRKWNAAERYDAGGGGPTFVATDSTHVWSSLINNNVNNPPASSPADWSALTPQNTWSGINSVTDYTQQQQMATLWLAHSGNEPGHIMVFFNGVHVIFVDSRMENLNGHVTYHPTAQGVTHNGWAVADQLTYAIILGIPNAGSYATSWDYVRVTQ